VDAVAGRSCLPHQYAVDAWAAKHASAAAPPIRTTFALVGLYLACERAFTRREVQLAHMRLARRGGRSKSRDMESSCSSLTSVQRATRLYIGPDG
jgi:hypothetical protein